MSEEVVDFQIVAERILAAILLKMGPVQISVEDLIADYSNKQVAINQEDDEFVVFELVEIDES